MQSAAGFIKFVINDTAVKIIVWLITELNSLYQCFLSSEHSGTNACATESQRSWWFQLCDQIWLCPSIK